MNALKVAVVPPVGYAVIQILRRTMVGVPGAANIMSRLFGEGRSVIVSFWHAQQLMMPLAIPRLVAHVLISQHRDGELIDGSFARFGWMPCAAPAPEGAEALRRMIRIGRSGGNLALTPDG